MILLAGFGLDISMAATATSDFCLNCQLTASKHPDFVSANNPPMNAPFRLPFQRILAAVLILIGFSSGSFIPTATAATVVHWLTLSDGAWPASVKKVIAAFEAENPDIKIQLDTYPFRQLFETIEVRMKSQDK